MSIPTNFAFGPGSALDANDRQFPPQQDAHGSVPPQGRCVERGPEVPATEDLGLPLAPQCTRGLEFMVENGALGTTWGAPQPLSVWEQWVEALFG